MCAVYGPSSTDADGKVTLPVLVIDARYSVNVLARGYAATRASFRVQAGNNPEWLDVVLLASGRSLSGVVVDRAGNPLEGVQVQIMPALGKAYPRNQMLTKSDWLTKKKDGRFQFHDLPKVKYRLIATLFKPTGKLDDGGRPVKKRQVGKELRIEPTEKEIRIVRTYRKQGCSGQAMGIREWFVLAGALFRRTGCYLSSNNSSILAFISL